MIKKKNLWIWKGIPETPQEFFKEVFVLWLSSGVLIGMIIAMTIVSAKTWVFK